MSAGDAKRPEDGLGALREHLARAEISELSTSAAHETGEQLVARAAARLDEVLELEASLQALTIAAEREPRQLAVLVEAFLRRNSPPETLAEDLRALRKSRGKLPSLAAIGERVAKKKARLEIAAEVALGRACGGLADRVASRSAFDALVRLARQPGRYSRRQEALRALAVVARKGLGPGGKGALDALCRQLSDPREHRWVQAAAIDLFADLDPEAALELARQRFTKPGGGDDFLVRERIADVAASRRGAGDAPWQGVLELASKDPSEHVRLTSARRLESAASLATLAGADASAKVRTRALVSLASRHAATCTPLLAAALDRDAAALVIETSARCITTLARERTLAGADAAVTALTRAAARADVPERTRVVVLEELATVTVLSDAKLRVVHDLLEDALRPVQVGAAAKVSGPALESVTDEEMGRVLSVLARNDHALSAERSRSGFTIYRGENRMLRAWRLLLEVRRPLPSKRQGHSHAWGRVLRGSLRAPPAGLSELTVTNVPGERVLVAKRGDWGRHLPLVDDLLATPLLSSKPVTIYGPGGRTSIAPPATFGKRLFARLALTFGYVRLAEQRLRALGSDEPAVQRSYVDQVARSTGLRIRFDSHPFARSLPHPPELPASPSVPGASIGVTGPGVASLPAAMAPPANGALMMAAMAAPLAQLVDGISDLGHFAVRTDGNRLPHVAAYAAVALLGMLTRGLVVRRGIDADRRAIPLVIGGWGTRGKSGTERLKAGLFQGLGYETLVKTTGCEAMFIHAVPGVRAQEVFIYRPYDKATIWEQRDLLRLARRFGVRTFLWECMALQPDLVNVLQQQWMRDDYSTITNAYPDHEDVQGPSGQDVAEVISEFVPHGGQLLTSEDQMLPILRERARERGSSFESVGELDAALVGDDMLARFPYHEHPRNIALVCALAARLGVPQAVALAEMADNVVPDLGVLKTYPRVPHAGRTLAFTNGMSANERTGALSNWTRMEFDKHDPEKDPKRWIVTVVNNRADRVARSEVFARFIVDDIAAHQHVVIGTNVSGFMGFLRVALERHLAEQSPTKELAGSAEERLATIAARLERAFARLKIGAPTSASVLAELRALGLPALDESLLERVLAPSPGESLDAARAAVVAAMPALPSEVATFIVDTITRRRMAEGLRRFAHEHGLTAAPRVESLFRDTYRALFLARVVALPDSTLTGDQVIDHLAHGAPPGAHIDVMGVQNIKGTGLDFVYRWVSLDAVARSLAKLRSDAGAAREEALQELYAHDDYGLVDATEALRVLESFRPTNEELPLFEAVRARLGGIVSKRSAAMGAKRSRTLADRARLLLGTTFDYLDSVRRQSAARRVLEDLIAERISHTAAALEMRSILARAKGAWALETTTA
jgi:poly-gamma-glutamate synthase PgsB/CapB